MRCQACGTRVVGIRGSYMDRIVQTPQTHWARENTPAGLAAAIVETWGAQTHHNRAETSARIREQYSWEKVFTGLFKLYSDIAASYRS